MAAKNKLTKVNISLQILSAIFIVLGFMTNRIIIVPVAVIGMVYMLGRADWEQKIAFMVFMLSFSPIMKYSDEQTSLYILLRFALVVAYLYYRRADFNTKFLASLIALIVYSSIVSMAYQRSFLVQILNLILWFFIAVVIQKCLSEDNTVTVSRSLSNGVILTGLLGLRLDLIPSLEKAVRVESFVLSGSDKDIANAISRYAAFWHDPNMFAVILCAAMWLVYYEYSKQYVSFLEMLIRSGLLSFISAMTFSKSALILTAIFWGYIVFVSGKIKLPIKMIILFLVFLGALYFVWKNPEWLSNMVFRFSGDKHSNDVTMKSLTTGRNELWELYIDRLNRSDRWLFGNGVNPELPNGRGAHNIFLQCIYNIGIVGLILYVVIFMQVYRNTYDNREIKSINPVGLIGFLCIVSSMLFLDAMYIELFYYVLPLGFVMMKSYDSVKNKRFVLSGVRVHLSR